jgi:hypothetical protein
LGFSCRRKKRGGDKKQQQQKTTTPKKKVSKKKQIVKKNLSQRILFVFSQKRKEVCDEKILLLSH